MRKRLLCIVISSLAITLSGCGLKESKEHDTKMQELSKINIGDPSSYKYSSTDNRFKVISAEHFNNGTTYGELILTLVDKKEKTLYMQTLINAGQVMNTTLMVDRNGKPLIYEGNLD